MASVTCLYFFQLYMNYFLREPRPELVVLLLMVYVCSGIAHTLFL